MTQHHSYIVMFRMAARVTLYANLDPSSNDTAPGSFLESRVKVWIAQKEFFKDLCKVVVFKIEFVKLIVRVIINILSKHEITGFLSQLC